MTTYFKAVRPDGGSFNDPNFKWATEPGGVTTHPAFDRKAGDASGYLSVATVATDCTGFAWPCRLLEVEPAGCQVWTPDKDGLPNKRAGRAFRTVRELDAVDVFGPQGAYVAALLDRAVRITADEAKRLSAAWDAAWDAAGYAAGYAAWSAARSAAGYAAGDAARSAARSAAGYAAGYAAWYAAGSAAWDAAWYAASYAARALVTRDLIGQRGYTQQHYDLLTGSWRSVIGPIHPGDKDTTA